MDDDHRVQDGLRNRLIGPTVCHATRASPFYRQLYAAHNVDPAAINTIRDLHRAPVITKAMLRAAGTACLADAATTAVSHIQHTSGTTGEPFLIYRSMKEAAFIDAFFSRLARNRGDSRQGPLPIVLQLQPGYHGTSTSIPANLFSIEAILSDGAKLDLVLNLLQRRFEMPGVGDRVEALMGGDREICTVTAIAAARGREFGRSTGVRFVSLSGNIVSTYWRDRIADTWNAVVIDKFSMSEIFGGAAYCLACGGYHFDPHVVPELVSIEDLQPLESGMGLLLLSALHPFVQLQPMVRYLTGDLFRLDPYGCVAPRFEVRGRIEDALIDGVGPTSILLDGVMLRELLDRQPEIVREDVFPILRSEVARSAGFPRAQGRIRSDRGLKCYELLVEVDHSAFAEDRRQILREKLETGLLAASASLRDRVARGTCRFAVRLVPADTLDPRRRVPLWQHDGTPLEIG